MATVGTRRRSRDRAAVSRWRRTCSTRSLSFLILSRMIRRSVSSCVSPGPREPMPPWVRDRCVHSRVRRGSWYSSWASSTCRRPSWVRACWAKMSRISPLRSRTLTPSRLSSAFCWLGLSSSSATSSVKPVSALACDQLLGLALADVPVGVDVAAVLPLGADDLRAGGVGQVGELGQRFLGRPAGVLAGVDGDQEGTLDGRREVDHARFRGLTRNSIRGAGTASAIREGPRLRRTSADIRRVAMRNAPMDEPIPELTRT